MQTVRLDPRLRRAMEAGASTSPATLRSVNEASDRIHRAGRPRRGERLPLDTSLARRFLKIRGLKAPAKEKVSRYLERSQWDPSSRVVHQAILRGDKTASSLASSTGYSPKRIKKALSRLEVRGAIKGSRSKSKKKR